MIQRIQSIYLFLATLITTMNVWFGDLWKVANDWIQAEDNLILMTLFLASALISFLTIFLFSSRKVQLRMGVINIILNILLIGYLIYSLLNLPGGFDSEKGIGLLTPFLTIVLLVIANRSIHKDEKLVKSVDRFR